MAEAVSLRTRERKDALFADLIARLEAEVATMTRAARAAHEAATHEESKPENDKDTRALEAAYLAGAQAERVRDLELAIKMLATLERDVLPPGTTARAGAVVTLEDGDGARSTYLLVPHGGGVTLEGGATQAITPQSPLGKAILGRAAGDVVELRVRGRSEELSVLDVW